MVSLAATKQPARSLDLRPPSFAVAMRNGDSALWNKLHDLGMKSTGIEEKAQFYGALAHTLDPALIAKNFNIALTDELPPSAAIFLIPRIARETDRADLALAFAEKNFKALSAKTDSLSANGYLPRLFSLCSDPARIDEMKSFAARNLNDSSKKPIAIATDEIQFRHGFRQRLIEQIAAQ